MKISKFRFFILLFVPVFGVQYPPEAWTTLQDLLTSLPQCRIAFWLYTSPSDLVHINPLNDSSVKQGNISSERPIKIILHGFNDNFTNGGLQEIKNAMLRVDNVQVIMVDWSDCSKTPIEYVQDLLFKNKRVGVLSAMLLVQLNKWLNVTHDQFHVIGHSLGAQASAAFSEVVIEVLGVKLDRITGLDPAGFLLFLVAPGYRLEARHAQYVDIIHTGTDIIYVEKYSIGHADFYPNNGKIQPGCSFWDDQFHACSHMRGISLFAESVQGPDFMGYECPNYQTFLQGSCLNCLENPDGCASMGYNAKKHGVFYFMTRKLDPYYGKNVKFTITRAGSSNRFCGRLSIGLRSGEKMEVSTVKLRHVATLANQTWVDAFSESVLTPHEIGLNYSSKWYEFCPKQIKISFFQVMDDQNLVVVQYNQEIILNQGEEKVIGSVR